MLEWLNHLDMTFFLLVNHTLTHPALDLFFVTITNSKFWTIPGIALALIYFYFGKKKALVVIGLSLLTVAITDPLGAQLIKPLAHRMRPCNPDLLVAGGRFLLGLKTSWSFPSNHAMNMFGQAMLLTLFYPRKWLYFFTFAALIGYSRIYVGVHFPLDVAGGAIFGMVAGACVYGGYRVVMKKRQESEERHNRADSCLLLTPPQAAPAHLPHHD